MKKYKCRICGFVIDLKNIDNYKCPMCNVVNTFDELEEVEIKEKAIYIESDNNAIQRIYEKCIDCGVCNKICLIRNKYDDKNPECLSCGKCVMACPMGAIVPKYEYKRVLNDINNNEKVVVVIVAPAVRVSIGDGFDYEYGSNIDGKIVSGLKKVGFDYVFDATFGADLTTMEEAYELLERIDNNKNLPMFTSCCPSWVKYLENYYPELVNHLSSCKSPIAMQTSIIKSYFANVKGINPNNLVTVALTPCTAKKMEKEREELGNSCDYVLTASEAILMFRELNIDLKDIDDEEYDEMFSRGSGAGMIFGNTGGVMQSTLRTFYYIKTGKKLNLSMTDFSLIDGMNKIKEASIRVGEKDINVLVINGIENVDKILESVKINKCKYHFIEVMNCEGGCIGGGGQPLNPMNKTDEIRKLRMDGLKNIDNSSIIRYSFENPDILDIYNNYLDKPLSSKSIELLHTTFRKD